MTTIWHVVDTVNKTIRARRFSCKSAGEYCLALNRFHKQLRKKMPRFRVRRSDLSLADGNRNCDLENSISGQF